METLQDGDDLQSSQPIVLFTMLLHRELFLNISGEFCKEGKIILVDNLAFKVCKIYGSRFHLTQFWYLGKIWATLRYHDYH